LLSRSFFTLSSWLLQSFDSKLYVIWVTKMQVVDDEVALAQVLLGKARFGSLKHEQADQ
jgi:hypothetical protein